MEQGMELALLKIAIAAATVVGLAEIAKRIDPVLSGVLLGLPLGAGLSVYFVAAEQGVDFVVPGLPWAIAGLCSAVVFCTVYLAVGQRLKCGRLLEVAGCSVAAMAAFFGSAALVRSPGAFTDPLPPPTTNDQPPTSWKQFVAGGWWLFSLLVVAAVCGWCGVWVWCLSA